MNIFESMFLNLLFQYTLLLILTNYFLKTEFILMHLEVDILNAYLYIFILQNFTFFYIYVPWKKLLVKILKDLSQEIYMFIQKDQNLKADKTY